MDRPAADHRSLEHVRTSFPSNHPCEPFRCGRSFNALTMVCATPIRSCCNETWGTVALKSTNYHDIIVEYTELRCVSIAFARESSTDACVLPVCAHWSSGWRCAAAMRRWSCAGRARSLPNRYFLVCRHRCSVKPCNLTVLLSGSALPRCAADFAQIIPSTRLYRKEHIKRSPFASIQMNPGDPPVASTITASGTGITVPGTILAGATSTFSVQVRCVRLLVPRGVPRSLRLPA